MRIIADLHIHSKYSRATSRDMDLDHIAKACLEKGINIVGTGDFTHPEWLRELKEKLVPAEEGLYKLKNKNEKIPEAIPSGCYGAGKNQNLIRFVITGEISSIYSRGGKTRRMHNVILLPSLESAEKISNVLSWEGNLKSDGRPILGIDAEELLKTVMEIEPNAIFIPAHIWTPWFSVFGSMSGFNSLEEAFGENTKHLAALETGLSSSPSMNWRVSALDKFALISNSDAHSPGNLGREANVFDIELSYFDLRKAITEKDKTKFSYTIEFFPEEGKYHYDGHRLCQIRTSPEETKKIKGICPKCGRNLTVGVLSRVDELADRKMDFVPPGAIPYKSLVPLKEIIAEALAVQPKTKTVEEEYKKLIYHFGSEFNILIGAEKKDLEINCHNKIAEGIIRVREGKIIVEPGYDGEFGKVGIFHEAEKKEEQNRLF